MAGGWQFRTSILSPLVVNLSTALILFFCVVVFKPQIYEFLSPKSESYPLVYFVEGYMEEGTQRAYLYIANLENDAFEHSDLLRRVGLASAEAGVAVNPDLQVSWTRGGQGILNIEEDERFNGEKGELTVLRPEDTGGEWSIRVDWIKPRKMLRAKVTTDYEREISPASPLYPYEIEYPGP